MIWPWGELALLGPAGRCEESSFRKGIIPLYTALVRPHLEHRPLFAALVPGPCGRGDGGRVTHSSLEEMTEVGEITGPRGLAFLPPARGPRQRRGPRCWVREVGGPALTGSVIPALSPVLVPHLCAAVTSLGSQFLGFPQIFLTFGLLYPCFLLPDHCFLPLLFDMGHSVPFPLSIPWTQWLGGGHLVPVLLTPGSVLAPVTLAELPCPAASPCPRKLSTCVQLCCVPGTLQGQ